MKMMRSDEKGREGMKGDERRKERKVSRRVRLRNVFDFSIFLNFFPACPFEKNRSCFSLSVFGRDTFLSIKIPIVHTY